MLSEFIIKFLDLKRSLILIYIPLFSYEKFQDKSFLIKFYKILRSCKIIKFSITTYYFTKTI